jgi:hypothetical protein
MCIPRGNLTRFVTSCKLNTNPFKHLKRLWLYLSAKLIKLGSESYELSAWMGVLDYIEISWQKQEKNGDNWSSTSMYFGSFCFWSVAFFSFLFRFWCEVPLQVEHQSVQTSEETMTLFICKIDNIGLWKMLFSWHFENWNRKRNFTSKPKKKRTS